MTEKKAPDGAQFAHITRLTLCAFLFMFMASRITVFLIMTRRAPDLYLHLGGNHVHHLNYGIFLLSAVGGILLFLTPRGRLLEIVAVLYGAGLALTFDEFGMWLHLGGSYWQRASWDAISVVGAILALIAYAPALARFRTMHWCVLGLLGMTVFIFAGLLFKSLRNAEEIVTPRLLQIEERSPR